MARRAGLGLATVYSIIRKHQGHIEVESEPGRGTTFRFWLPAAKVAPAAEVAGTTLPDRLAGRVLFMDDEETIRRMAQALLASPARSELLASVAHPRS